MDHEDEDKITEQQTKPVKDLESETEIFETDKIETKNGKDAGSLQNTVRPQNSDNNIARNGDSGTSNSSEMIKSPTEKSVKQVEMGDLQEVCSASRENKTKSGKSKRGISEGQVGDHSKISMEESKSSLDADSSKRQKTEETANGSLDAVNEDQVPLKFHKLKSKVRNRNYRGKQNLPDEATDNSDEIVASESTGEDMDTGNVDDATNSEDSTAISNEGLNLDAGEVENRGSREENSEELGENSEEEENGNDGGDDDSDEWTSASDNDSVEPDLEVLSKEKPKPQWFIVPELINRQLGSNALFQRRFYGSLHTVQRLELMYKLKVHKGCVNTLSFNQRGNLLASGSDDLMVVIWNWALGKKQHSFKTGHRSNVFQASWLPLPVEHLMVTCARDGQVRLADLHRPATDYTRRLAIHDGPATKLSIHPDLPHVILSVSEDAAVFLIDIRQSKPTTLLTVKEGNSHVAIYSVNSNPLNSNEFCLGGRDQYVRIYDKRKASSPLHKMCPKHLQTNKHHAHVTCAKYNYNGSEIVGSYNDEDIYLFDTLLPSPIGDFAHRYQGHRNNATVKGVNFFGPKSEFVISGSDCGNIYVWEKNTEAIVQWMAGDECGVVNRLEPHPHIPVLATSGLDYDVKVWVPSCEEPPSMKNLETCVRQNMKSRERDVSREPDAFDGQLLWFLWRQGTETEELRRRIRNFGRWAGNGGNRDDIDSSSDDSSNHSNSPSEDESDGRPQCSPS
ncbi:DDB1- and CUL4-associated factor 8 isoform X2 [Athalia rosae]|uniref:DDB1- and CUL4-associated factor 8 isoform X2 n=1 Tax=Athalia rosae TaxID=37344 RepID=UPI0020346900|nr:DDB1- and CUL4-associated factor 8 isoform X2 [Athalia rosae]